MNRSLLFAAALAIAGCKPPECAEPIYEGKASDEAYLSILDAESRATKDDSKATIFTSPTAGQSFTATDSPVFGWTSGLMALAPPPRRAPAEPAFHLMDYVYASAWAHLPPVTGAVYWLRFKVAGNSCPALAVLTTETEYAPDSAAWASLQGKSLTLSGLAVYLQENRVTEGPFIPTTDVAFSIAK